MPKAQALVVERRKLDALKPYAQNAKVHTPDQVERLAKSLTEFGWTNPVLIDPAGEIIAGHGRVAAAEFIRAAGGKIRGWPKTTDVPVIVLKGLSAEQRRAYRIADNKLSELGRWDGALLGLELKDLHGVGFDLALTGLGDLELRSINADSASAFLLGLGAGDPESAADPPRRHAPGFVQLAFTMKPDDRRDVMASLRAQQAQRKLPSAAAALLAICQELRS